jgi:hypothetical protein
MVKPTLAPIVSCETLSEFDSPDICDSPEEIFAESSDSSDETYTTTAAITIPTSRTTMAHSAPPQAPYVTFAYIPGESSTDDYGYGHPGGESLKVPSPILGGGSSETLNSTNGTYSLGSAASSDTLVPGSPNFSPIVSPLGSPKRVTSPLKIVSGFKTRKPFASPIKIPTSHQLDALALSPASSPKFTRPILPIRRATSPTCTVTPPGRVPSPGISRAKPTSPSHSPVESPKLKRVPSPISYSFSSPNIITNLRSKGNTDTTIANIWILYCYFFLYFIFFSVFFLLFFKCAYIF